MIFRNQLIEFNQYAPPTETVFAEPVLIVSAWIMKYYIVDLSPQLADQIPSGPGPHGVRRVRHNPGPADRDLGIED